MPKKKHECPAFSEGFDLKDTICAECADAEKCNAAMEPWECPAFGEEYDSEDPTCAECEEKENCQEEMKLDRPSPKKVSTPGGRQGNQFM